MRDLIGDQPASAPRGELFDRAAARFRDELRARRDRGRRRDPGSGRSTARDG
jgi:hypothetical protein